MCDNSANYLNGKVMVAAAVSLPIVVVLVALLHLFARYVIRRQARHLAATREPGLLNVIQWQASAEPPKRGLEPSVLAALPVYAYRQVEGESEWESSVVEECIVCLGLLEEGELTRILPNCQHVPRGMY
ncbi:hypothetical protein MLD38_025877 [Melastoma candidum]|nr:hypothetical protein MLD38_025877 [Melastoma candidum]